MIRFNKKGGFNVPFGKKPNRFAKSYVTKIVNQVHNLEILIQNNEWQFICQDFSEAISQADINDMVYCDPPYIGRHVDYFDSWSEEDEIRLSKILEESKAKFMLSTRHSNEYRHNEYLPKIWGKYNMKTREHFYHLGAKESNRKPMLEAIIMNYDTIDIVPIQTIPSIKKVKPLFELA